jgi:hypothetical protein
MKQAASRSITGVACCLLHVGFLLGLLLDREHGSDVFAKHWLNSIGPQGVVSKNMRAHPLLDKSKSIFGEITKTHSWYFNVIQQQFTYCAFICL